MNGGGGSVKSERLLGNSEASYLQTSRRDVVDSKATTGKEVGNFGDSASLTTAGVCK